MEKLRIGIVGASDWAEMMYVRPLQRHPLANVAAICARSTDRAKALAARYGIHDTWRDWREMIETANLDAIAIVGATRR